jgi:hypothetical protein
MNNARYGDQTSHTCIKADTGISKDARSPFVLHDRLRASHRWKRLQNPASNNP